MVYLMACTLIYLSFVAAYAVWVVADTLRYQLDRRRRAKAARQRGFEPVFGLQRGKSDNSDCPQSPVCFCFVLSIQVMIMMV
jgi:hypothetical protein